MKNSTSNDEDIEVRSGGMLVQRREPDDDGCGTGPSIMINVSCASSQHEISLPAQSTFGYVKEVIERKTGVGPRRQTILFRGKEKEDWELLHEAGVKDKSKILVLENEVSKEKKPEEIKESEETPQRESKVSEDMSKTEVRGREEMSKTFQAIGEVREEINKLAERVSVLEVAIKEGTKIAEEEFAMSSELLMRQLLKLDAIEAEGEAKIQRKAEVRRVQNYHELLDNLKTSNSRPSSNSNNSVSVTTEWESFDSGVGSLDPPVSSSTRITQDWERFD
ncbi:BAG family molecular chaperone regulator 4 [Euphorbia lathyris]|uniref:BAG family molecular chaperone regulator 4 n=1 Tax=Euphorbia lathyris TaxID=212925 RepID=UPI003313A063